ncbi:putative integral membrane protein [Theileria parva strain Muguga]|uniref:putative integral membrane protein n=1 Tax=Theileria parva strain Muguga TaxID=333668 RepID=UPI001C61AEEA|nr:putative integral membrane protein [Theileria parva strain Muguga]KAF5153614.1 putative integral membrane protein [Theileria parva strain Muguga]
MFIIYYFKMTFLRFYSKFIKNTSGTLSPRFHFNRNMSTNVEKFHNASPRLPLLYYKASKRAMESINHRVFYANWIFVFAAYDLFTTFVDF